MIEILMKGGAAYPITEAAIDQLVDSYPALDKEEIELELQALANWSEVNVDNRKTLRGMSRFIVNWMNRYQRDRQRRGRNTSTRNRSMKEDLTDRSWAK